MKTKQLLISLTLGLGLVMALLWLLGGGVPNLALAQGPDGYDTYYVAPGGDCDGMTPCFDSVQNAVDAVDDPDDGVKVATGIYTDVSARGGVNQVVYISKTVTIRGGYTTTDWRTPDSDANLTTLDAQRQGRVLYIRGDISPTIDGFTITGGDVSGRGGGIAIYSASPMLSHNIATNNHATGYGGGIYVIGSAASPILNSNWIISNATSSNGGGIFIDDYSSPILVNNVIARNCASSNGAGIYIDFYSTPSIINNTIVANNCGPSWANEGIFIYNNPSPTIVNNIIVTHACGIEGTSPTTMIDYNDVWACSTSCYCRGADPGPHDISEDPRFVDPANDDYHLLPNSPAIDVGTNVYAPSMDFDDESRPLDGNSDSIAITDIGADEFCNPSLAVTKRADPDPVQAGGPLIYTLHVTNTGNVMLTATITDVLPNQVTPGGVLTRTLIITAPGGVWTEHVIVTAKIGYSGTLTNVVEVTTAEGARGVYTETSQAQVTPALTITKQADPDPVQAGSQLTYTIWVTNTGSVDLTVTITDVLPDHITTAQPLTWTPTITAPGGVWMEQVVVTVEMCYSGTLTNVVQVTTEEGVTGVYTETSNVIIGHCIYLPVILRSY